MPEENEIARRIRKQLSDTFGSDFAAKASDELCLMMASAPRSRGGGFAEAGPLASQPVILEMASDELIDETKKRWAAYESAVTGNLAAGWPEAGPEHEKRRVGDHLRKAVRASAVEDLRRRFGEASRAVTQRLEESARSLAAVESVTAETSRPFVQVCWLNGTASTAGFTPALAEVAASADVRAFDSPRRLYREVDATASVIAGPAFRETHGVGGRGVVVAVIDSEIELGHPRLAGLVSQRENYTGEGWGVPGKHGTAVAGIIHEIAPEATIWNYKVFAQQWWLDSNDFGGALALQRALEDGAHVANCSWGSGPATDGSSREARACNTAWSFGLTVVKSAGNTGPGVGSLSTPADADGVIVVGATDREGRSLGDYSSRGPTGHGAERPHLVAPGGLSLPGLGIRSSQPGGLFQEAGYGTSFAAPHVSGAIALLLELRPDLAPDAIRDQVIACCAPIDDHLGRNDQGAGLLDLLALKPPA